MKKKRLELLFKRQGNDKAIAEIAPMPEGYTTGWFAGFCCGRDSQRTADIEVACKLLKEDTNGH